MLSLFLEMMVPTSPSILLGSLTFLKKFLSMLDETFRLSF